MIFEPKQIPLKQFPTSASEYRKDLQNWLQSQLELGYRYAGYISKTVGKHNYLAHVFVPDDRLESVMVLDSSASGIINYPATEASLAKSVSESLEKLANQGWLYSGLYFKKISTSHYNFLVFYSYKKTTRKTQSKSQDKLVDVSGNDQS